ncbi:S-adenosyl-L-methionine-dependent methyltransferase [Nemania sp. NC0429]|nr:S-adenosyl-L-methionine-dependent methyltransferase [Nemania sp. NC0429]
MISPPDYEKQSYWNERFASETAFEWLVPSATFVELIKPYLSVSDKSQRILNLGSGTSDLHTHFRSHGYCDVTSVDFGPRALDRGREMEEKAFGDTKTHYAVADVTKLGHDLGRPNAFDLVVDKSTADSVSCGGDDAMRDMAQGVRECLAAGGVWISLSYSAVRFELEDLPFEVQVIEKILTPKARPMDPDIFYWCYLLRPK